MYTKGAEAGWWACPYGCEGGGNVGLSEETILRNTLGLKNVTNSLLELRSSGGQTRPDEGNAPTTGAARPTPRLWTFHQFLDYHRANSATSWSPHRGDRIPGRQHRPDRLPRIAAHPGAPGAAPG